MRIDTLSVEQFFAARPSYISHCQWITNRKNKYRRRAWYDKVLDQIEFWSEEEGHTYCYQRTLAAAVGVCERSLRTALRFFERIGAVITERDNYQNYYRLNPDFFKKELIPAQKEIRTQAKREDEDQVLIRPIAAEVAGGIAAHEINKDLKLNKRSSIISRIVRSGKNEDDRKDPIIKEYEELTRKQFKEARDKAALERLKQFSPAVVLASLLHGAYYAAREDRTIGSLAYFIPIAEQVRGSEHFLTEEVIPGRRAQLAKLKASRIKSHNESDKAISGSRDTSFLGPPHH